MTVFHANGGMVTSSAGFTDPISIPQIVFWAITGFALKSEADFFASARIFNFPLEFFLIRQFLIYEALFLTSEINLPS